MNPLKLTLGVAATAALAMPAAASAHETASAQSVRAHVRSADQALTRITRLVERDRDAAAAAQMVRNRRETQAATREAGRLRDREARATALRLVAGQHDENVETYAGLVDDVTGDMQTGMARAIGAGVSGRETALGTLTRLMPKLPASAQRAMANAITALSSTGQDEVLDIGTAMGSGQLSDVARSYLEKALAKASTAMTAGLERLQDVVAVLPSAAQGSVRDAIDRVTELLQRGPGTGTPHPGANVTDRPVPADGAPAVDRPAQADRPSTHRPAVTGLPLPTDLPSPAARPAIGGR